MKGYRGTRAVVRCHHFRFHPDCAVCARVPATIGDYLAALEQSVSGSRSRRRRVVEEVRSHLTDVAADLARNGHTDSEFQATAQLGAPRRMAADFGPGEHRWRRMVLTGVAASFVVMLTVVGVLSDSARSEASQSCLTQWDGRANDGVREVANSGGPLRLARGVSASTAHVAWRQVSPISLGPPLQLATVQHRNTCKFVVRFHSDQPDHAPLWIKLDGGDPHHAYRVTLKQVSGFAKATRMPAAPQR